MFNFEDYLEAGHHEPMDLWDGMSSNVLHTSEKIPYPMSDKQVYRFALDVKVSECCSTANIAILKAAIQSERKAPR